MKKSIVYVLVCIGTLFAMNNARADARSDQFSDLQRRWNVLSEKKEFLLEMVTNFISQASQDSSDVGRKEVSNAPYLGLKSFFDQYNAFSNECYDFHKKYRDFSNISPAFYRIVNDVIVFNNTTLLEVNNKLKLAAEEVIFKARGISGQSGTISDAITPWISEIKQQTDNWNSMGRAIAKANS